VLRPVSAPAEVQREIYRTMPLIRRFEERVAECFAGSEGTSAVAG
jgi:TPP-dependent pyruvate/acetoin dehydrogenase alpha subunit